MTLVENDDMIEAFAANRPDQAFRLRILPGRPWSDDDFLDAHVRDSFPEDLARCPIAISDQKPRDFVKRERFDHLLRRPLGCRVSCYVEVNDFPAAVTEHDKGDEYSKCGRRDGEEVDGNDVGQMVIQKRSPSL